MIRFVKLDLRAAAAVRKEVDNAIRDYTAALEEKEVDRVEAYRSAFESRIDELEDFYLDHEDDERAILFEKQRMRLRRALALAQAVPATRRPLPDTKERDTPASKKTPKTPLSSKTLTMSMLGDRDSPPPPDDTPPPDEVQLDPPPPPDAKKSTKPPKPLYGWEMRSDLDAAPPRRTDTVETASGVFYATDVPGVYASRDRASPQPFIDIDFVLTDAEYDQFVALRRAHRHKQQINDRLNNHTTPYINSALPYVDAACVENSIYRPPNKKANQQPIWQY